MRTHSTPTSFISRVCAGICAGGSQPRSSFTPNRPGSARIGASPSTTIRWRSTRSGCPGAESVTLGSYTPGVVKRAVWGRTPDASILPSPSVSHRALKPDASSSQSCVAYGARPTTVANPLASASSRFGCSTGCPRGCSTLDEHPALTISAAPRMSLPARDPIRSGYVASHLDQRVQQRLDLLMERAHVGRRGPARPGQTVANDEHGCSAHAAHLRGSEHSGALHIDRLHALTLVRGRLLATFAIRRVGAPRRAGDVFEPTSDQRFRDPSDQLS